MSSKAAVSLVTVTLCCCACHQRQPTRGFKLDIAASSESCGDGRELVLIAVGGGNAKLNSGPAAGMAEAIQRIHEANRYRANKIVWVEAGPDVSWGEFMELADRAWPETQVLSLLTPQVDAMVRRHGCLETPRNTARPPYSLH